MAKAAASYVHPKLAAIEHGGQVDTVDLPPRETVLGELFEIFAELVPDQDEKTISRLLKDKAA